MMAGPDGDFMALLRFFLPSIPALLLWLIGAVLAMVFWKRQPQVGLLVLLASLLNVLGILVGNFFSWYLPRMIDQQGLGHEQLGLWFGILGYFRVGVHTLAGALLLWAAFGWRKPAQSDR